MIKSIFLKNGKQLSFAYGLTALGHLADILYPLATGIAINGVLSGNYAAVGWLIGCHLAELILMTTSKMVDTRIFAKLYATLAGDIVRQSHSQEVDPSVIAARAALSREYVTFFEVTIQLMLYAAIALVVSLSALFWFDTIIGAFCLFLIIPLLAISRWLGKRSGRLNKGLNDRLEKEIDLLREGRSDRVARHFKALGGWRVKLSDGEAHAYAMMESSVIILFAAALWRIGEMPQVQAGDVYAIFSYVWRFVSSLDQVPQLVQQWAKLRDLDQRMGLDEGA
jgi:ABC-type multidrug transport system fused ATPase/permease subunit